MNRIDRLNAILIYLQTKPKVNMAELENRFELTRRTLFRDIRALIDSGVPIGGDAGEGYFIVEGYHLPPVVFNKEEASAILIGAKLIEHNADAQTSLSFQNALTKVKAVLRFSDREFLEELENSISILPTPGFQKNGFPDSHIAEIQYAIASHRKLHISYHSNYNDQATDRDIEPLGLVNYTNRWHVIAYCHLRKELRDFRTDRIRKLSLTQESFDPRLHPNYLEFVNDSLRGTDAKEVKVHFRNEISRFVSDQRFFYGFIDEKNQGDWVEMRFFTPSYHMIGRWLLSYGNGVKVIDPPEFRSIIEKLAKESYDQHRFVDEKNQK